ncbi:hypothetical protein ACSBR2_035878 [Camellia fascicularis]
MASSSINNNNIRLKPRMCDCGRTTAHSNKNKAHCNYFKSADDDDENVTSTIRSNTGPRQALTIEELYELRAIVSEMENQIHRRL